MSSVRFGLFHYTTPRNLLVPARPSFRSLKKQRDSKSRFFFFSLVRVKSGGQEDVYLACCGKAGQ